MSIRFKKKKYFDISTGKMGRLIGSTGLKIAYLSGVELPENLRENKNAIADTFNKYNVYISRRLVKSMIDSVGSGIDILLTSQWPKDVTNYAISLVSLIKYV